MNPLVRVLRDRAHRTPDRTALRWGNGTDWTADQLWRKVRDTAAGLTHAGINTGDHLLLVLPEVQPAVAGLFAAWTIGAVPIQVGLPPRATQLEDFAAHLEALVRRLRIRALVVPQHLVELAEFHLTGTTIVPMESILRASATHDDIATADTPALIQLTSGTTGIPRGVVLSQQNLAAHLDAIAEVLPAGSDASGVTWLPLYHDMGLIGGLLYPLWTDFPVTLLTPLDFRASPYRWLTEMFSTCATHTVAPPSAYGLINRYAKRARRDGLSLDTLRCAMVGAEPIAPRVLHQFAEAFAPCGFRDEAFFPVYGLAEAAVAVTFPLPLSPTVFDRVDARQLSRDGLAVPSSDGGFELTAVGRPIPGTRIRLVDSTNRSVPDRVVGEILVKTTTGMSEYFDDPSATDATFQDGWLRTGDLGYLVDGELFVTGRIKDLIITAGRNLSPQAVEDIASQEPGVRAGGAVAVGVRSEQRSTERAVLVVETKLAGPDQPQLQQRIHHALASRGLAVDEIRLVPAGTLPRTSSGKAMRYAVAASLASGA